MFYSKNVPIVSNEIPKVFLNVNNKLYGFFNISLNLENILQYGIV